MSQWLKFCFVASVSCGLLAGCGSFDRTARPGETSGSIYVSSPRISGRERLINDRRAQEEWLQEQLRKSDQERFDVSGLIDTRTLAVTAARLQARVDPAFDVYRAQQQAGSDIVREQGASALAAERLRAAAIDGIRTKLDKGEIDAKEAQAQLQALGISFPPFSAPPTSVSAPSVAGAGTAASNVGSPFLDSVKAGTTKAPSPVEAVSANATASPIDLFRDRLALREEIRSEINENALDDTHDLHRHTLYRLTFDATVLPDDDTSAWAVVDVSFEPPSATQSLWEPYREYLEDRFQRKLLERANKLNLALPTCTGSNVTEQMRCAAQKVFVGKVQQQVLAMLDAIPSTTAKLDVFAFSSNLRLFGQTVKRAGPDRGGSLSDAEQVIYQVLAGVLVREFNAEKLDCYYRLVSNSFRQGDYPPAADSRDLQEYLVAVRAPDFAAGPARTVRERTCGYTAPPANSIELATQFAIAISKRVEPRVYAVTPKESVQRLSDVSSRRAATEFLLGLNAIGGAGGIDAMLQSVRQNEAFMHAIRRQPLVVGYTSAGAAEYVLEKPKDKESKPAERRMDALGFGWILGPQFAITKDGARPSFRHSVRQQALSATIIAPIWWDNIKMKVRATWHRESTSLNAFSAVPFEKTYSVELPRKLSALDGLLDSGDDREPEVETAYNTTVRVGEPARLLIRGEHLWRSSEVFIGSQPANRVRLLPDMRGLVAEFDRIQPVFGASSVTGRADSLDITVGTSDGFARVGAANVVRDDGFRPRSIVGIGRRFIGDQTTTLVVDPPLQGFRTVEVVARSSANASLNVKVADLGSGLEISRDGTSLRLTPKAADIKLQAGDPIDLLLAVTSDTALAPEYVAITRDAIYYPKASDHAAKLEWASSGTGLRKIKLTFPPGARRGFANMAGGRVDVTVQLSAGEKSVSLNSQVCAFDKGACVLTLRLPETTAAELVAAAKSGDFTLSVKLGGQDVPELSPSSLIGK